MAHELEAAAFNNFLYICSEDGQLFNLSDAIGHAVKNQYKVEYDQLKLRGNSHAGPDYQDMQKVYSRKANRRV